MRIAANIDWLFTEHPRLDRPAAARAAGFDGIEIAFPYDCNPQDWAAALNGLPVALINTPAGDWAAGERGFAAVPGAETRFREGFAQALDMARTIDAARIHVMAGTAAPDDPRALETFVTNLAWATAHGHPLTIEPLNPADMPGYHLADYTRAATLALMLGVGVQFDSWHAARLGGTDTALQIAGPHITHAQIAGEPDRGEPDAASLALARRLTTDWIAAEYRPRGPTARGLAWLETLRRPA
jgi:hydroxypyruvate isomerase